MPLTPTQEAFLASWLRKHKKPVQRRTRTLPCSTQNEAVELPTPAPSSGNQKEPVELPTPNPPGGSQKNPNPKWKDDAWFEKQYGDPNYYKRIKGLD